MANALLRQLVARAWQWLEPYQSHHVTSPSVSKVVASSVGCITYFHLLPQTLWSVVDRLVSLNEWRVRGNMVEHPTEQVIFGSALHRYVLASGDDVCTLHTSQGVRVFYLNCNAARVIPLSSPLLNYLPTCRLHYDQHHQLLIQLPTISSMEVYDMLGRPLASIVHPRANDANFRGFLADGFMYAGDNWVLVDSVFYRQPFFKEKVAAPATLGRIGLQRIFVSGEHGSERLVATVWCREEDDQATMPEQGRCRVRVWDFRSGVHLLTLSAWHYNDDGCWHLYPELGLAAFEPHYDAHEPLRLYSLSDGVEVLRSRTCIEHTLIETQQRLWMVYEDSLSYYDCRLHSLIQANIDGYKLYRGANINAYNFSHRVSSKVVCCTRESNDRHRLLLHLPTGSRIYTDLISPDHFMVVSFISGAFFIALAEYRHNDDSPTTVYVYSIFIDDSMQTPRQLASIRIPNASLVLSMQFIETVGSNAHAPLFQLDTRIFHIPRSPIPHVFSIESL